MHYDFFHFSYENRMKISWKLALLAKTNLLAKGFYVFRFLRKCL